MPQADSRAASSTTAPGIRRPSRGGEGAGGKGGRDTVQKELQAAGIKVLANISTEAGQLDFSSVVLKAKQTNADALFVYTNEEESARALKELRKRGYDKPVIGETTLANDKVIELAGDAANGVIAHVGLTPDAPNATV